MMQMKGPAKIMYCLLIISLVLNTSWIPIDSLSQLEARYNEYKKKFPYMIVNLHFNQPAYIPGDTIFFSARYMHENFQPVMGTHLIRLDVISESGVTVQRIRFKVINGKGYNQLALKKDLREGVYRLVAYSDWMRNFGTDSFFQHDIRILSTGRLSIANNGNSKEYNFFPEGTTLIQGIENTVIVIGMPDSKLIIQDDEGTTITNVSINSLGVGSFVFTPIRGRKYFAYQKNAAGNWPLPAAMQEGVAMKLNSSSTEILLSLGDQSKYNGTELLALLLSEGEILTKQPIKIESQKPYRLQLPDTLELQKVYQLFIVDSRGVELAQRIFTGKTKKNDIHVDIQIDPYFKQRDSLTWQLKIADESGNPLAAEVSISAFREDLFNDRFVSENKITLSWPAMKALRDADSEAFINSINDILVSKTWKRISWESIFNNKAPQFIHPYQANIQFKGHILSQKDGLRVADSIQIIGFLQKNASGYETYSKDGSFVLPILFEFWGDDQIFITLRSNGKCVDDIYFIQEIEDTIDLGIDWKTERLPVEDPYADFALKRNLIMHSYNYYLVKKQQEVLIKSPNEILEEEFQGADHTVQVGDYIVFPSMDYLLSEVVNFVQYRKRKNASVVRLFYRYGKSVFFFKNDPLYVVDGIMSTSTEDFLKIKPENVLTIKIINNPNKLAHLGALGQNGIIFVETKRSEPSGKINRNVFSITGLSEAVSPPIRNYSLENRNRTMPDLRSTLFWNPNMTTGPGQSSKLKMFLSDDIGPMKIRIQGFTANGRPISAEKTFEVKMNRNRD
jgi:hypothetical protein